VDYAGLKTIHQAAVALSLAGFFVRGVGSLRASEWVRGRLAKTVPHIVDTVLLLSALALAWSLRLAPSTAPWLTAKIIGLLVYIALGTIALRPTRPIRQRALAWVAALLTFSWIASVAISKNPLGFVARLWTLNW